MELQKVSILWKILFGTEVDEHIDPNLPENIPRVLRERELITSAVNIWLESGGQLLLDKMGKDVKTKIVQVLYTVDRSTEQGKQQSLAMLDDIRRDVDFIGTMLTVVNNAERT